MDKKEYLNELNSITTKYDVDKDLFKGGCAFAAAVLARELETMGIKYEVICYVFPCFNDDYNPIKRGESCAHVAVKVNCGRKKMLIGGDIMEPWYMEVNVGMMKSDEITRYYRKIYRKGEWNLTWSAMYNSSYSRACRRATQRYISAA